MEHWKKILNKIVSLEKAIELSKGLKTNQKKIVFTNGCFDILHQGHVTYLAKAADYGDSLVVGLNSDASVRRLGKGEERPINKEESRALVLASLGFVDYVIIFDQDTPLNLLEAIRPDVLVKGGDYVASEENVNSSGYIVGSKEVRQNGGEVVTIPLEEGFSTTAIVLKLQSDKSR